MSFDTERFIIEIQCRSSLWDTSSNYYSNRDLKKKCWDKVIDLFGGEEMAPGEKKELEPNSRGFIATYRSEPCLWRIKSREYHDRDVREAAYDRLITKLKEIEPDANKSSVVKKINNFRSNVRKEKKKRDMSRKSGAGTDNVYSPKLWYFDLFDFLGDQDVPSTSSSNLDDEDVSEMDEEGTEGTIQQTPLIEEVSEQTIVTPNHRTRPKKKKLQAPLHPNIGKKRKSEELTNDILVSVRDHFKKPPPQDDRYDLMGKSIALRIRALEKRQRLIVEKKINDIIFEAEMGLMNTPTNSYNLVYQSSSSSTTPSPSPNESFYEFNSHQARISGLGSQEEHTHPLANYLTDSTPDKDNANRSFKDMGFLVTPEIKISATKRKPALNSRAQEVTKALFSGSSKKAPKKENTKLLGKQVQKSKNHKENEDARSSSSSESYDSDDICQGSDISDFICDEGDELFEDSETKFTLGQKEICLNDFVSVSLKEIKKQVLKKNTFSDEDFDATSVTDRPNVDPSISEQPSCSSTLLKARCLFPIGKSTEVVKGYSSNIEFLPQPLSDESDIVKTQSSTSSIISESSMKRPVVELLPHIKNYLPKIMLLSQPLLNETENITPQSSSSVVSDTSMKRPDVELLPHLKDYA
ncbi:hypothetical protein FQA39_LY07912 [Lamprigera yunnana]|nr:hypothetical protein FQA39_LY07912 [Lamprigera yunnana]